MANFEADYEMSDDSFSRVMPQQTQHGHMAGDGLEGATPTSVMNVEDGNASEHSGDGGDIEIGDIEAEAQPDLEIPAEENPMPTEDETAVTQKKPTEVAINVTELMGKRRKVGKQDFDVIRVLGKGGFGKVMGKVD